MNERDDPVLPSTDILPRDEIEEGHVTHEGNVRENNEDASLFHEPEDGVTLGRKGRLVVVADGMGGHLAGEVASQVAVDCVREQYLRREDVDPLESLSHAVTEANSVIYNRSTENFSERGMGTTCTALVLRQGQAFTAHVGDSRAYLIRNGAVTLLTRDHATPHGLLRALGAEDKVEVDMVGPVAVEPGDSFLVCSDGLTRHIEESEIGEIVKTTRSPQQACERLLHRALERGGLDNVTIRILRVLQAGGQPRVPPGTGATGNPIDLDDTQSLELPGEPAEGDPPPPPRLGFLILVLLLLALATAVVAGLL